MSEPPPKEKRPHVTDRALAEQQARTERQSAALRENLRKRKEQARARSADAASEPNVPPRR
jgi:hypothetical protein